MNPIISFAIIAAVASIGLRAIFLAGKRMNEGIALPLRSLATSKPPYDLFRFLGRAVTAEGDRYFILLDFLTGVVRVYRAPYDERIMNETTVSTGQKILVRLINGKLALTPYSSAEEQTLLDTIPGVTSKPVM